MTEPAPGAQPAILLVQPQLSENIGTAARAMANFGLTDLRLVSPREGWPSDKARSAASGADHVIDRVRVYETLPAAIADLSFVYATTARMREVAKRVVGPHEAAVASRARIAAGNAVGFLFGRERTGLNNEEVSLADEILTLPVDPRFSSLNIAQAVLIVAYEWRLAAEGDALPFAAAIAEQAPRDQLIAMFEHLEAALDDAGFFRPSEKRPHITLAIRAMLQRAGLTDQEVRTLRGMIAALERRPTRPRKTPTGLVTTDRGKAVTRLLVFDSGIGGLSVAREIRRTMPAAEIIYVADDAGFPYGDWEEPALTEHVVTLIGGLIGILEPAAVVIACHTASTLVMHPLRALHSLPFVGTVPAIKPAAAQTKSGLVSVLGTFGTIQREYTRALIQQFAGDCHVRLVGSANLASLAEAYMRGEAIDDAAVWAEIEPAFVERDGARTDVVVLACTHYPFLGEHFGRLAPWPVTWIDPAPAIARQVAAVAGSGTKSTGEVRGRAYMTSGRPWAPPVARLLDRLGLDAGVLPGVAKERA